MAGRACYGIVEGGVTRLYYHPAGGSRLPREMAFGSEVACAHVEGLVRTDRLLDEVWCQGFALIDRDRRELLLGSSHPDLGSPQRELYLELVAGSWPGWRLAWPREGILAVARHLDLPDEAVLNEVNERDVETASLTELELEAPAGERFDPTLLTLGTPGGEVLHLELHASPAWVLARGEGLVEAFSAHGRHALDPARVREERLQGGVWIEPGARRLRVFSRPAAPRLVERSAVAWPGWNLEWAEGGLAEQLAAVGVDPAPHLADRRRLLAWLITYLMADALGDPEEPAGAGAPAPSPWIQRRHERPAPLAPIGGGVPAARRAAVMARLLERFEAAEAR